MKLLLLALALFVALAAAEPQYYGYYGRGLYRGYRGYYRGYYGRPAYRGYYG